MVSPVAIVRCGSYDASVLRDAVARAWRLAGLGDARFYRGKEVLVKVNLLGGQRPESAVNTHPEFARAVLRHLVDLGARPTVSDSSGPFEDTRSCFESSGFAAMCKEEGVPIVPLSSMGYEQVEIPDGKRIDTALVARMLVEAEAVVSLPKLKTHMQTVLTGAVKNFFGALPLSERRRLHRLARYDVFSEAIVDLYSAVGRGDVLMDAVVGMQGTGPASGRPGRVGLVIASRGAAEVDVVAARVMGLSPETVRTVGDTIERGMASSVEQLQLLGEPLEEVVSPFDIPSRLLLRANPVIEKLTDVALGLYRSAVEVDIAKCTACGHCKAICPASAITIDKYCRIEYAKCISCYCCFEVCPYGAIRLREPILRRLLRRLRPKRAAQERAG